MQSPTEPYAQAFARAMEIKLQENAHKGNRTGWMRDSPVALAIRVIEEAVELLRACRETPTDTTAILGEAADVGNMAMMAADAAIHQQSAGQASIATRLPPTYSRLKFQVQHAGQVMEELAADLGQADFPEHMFTWQEQVHIRLLGLAGKLLRLSKEEENATAGTT